MNAKRRVTGDHDCDITCPEGPPLSCPMKTCIRKFEKFSRDMSVQETAKKEKKRTKGGTRG